MLENLNVSKAFFPASEVKFQDCPLAKLAKSFFTDSNVEELDKPIAREGSALEKFSELSGEVSSAKTYEDDNGKVFRIRDDLLSNNSFEINGYKYETDDQGRIISAEGELRIRDVDYQRDMKDSMDVVGKGDQQENDERGHLIGHQFGGSDRLENLVPMAEQLNKGDYKKMESLLADAVNEEADVREPLI